jgi:AcrR family transcriptional regulator
VNVPAGSPAGVPRRADAARNRDTILTVARAAFEDQGAGEVSMAEIARRANVGMATLYRNFPGKRQLLEAVFTDEVDEICAAATPIHGQTPGASFAAWIRRFFDFAFARNAVATELIIQFGGVDNTLFTDDRAKICTAAQPLLADAQTTHEFRDDLDIGQMLDLMVAVARVHGDANHVRPIAEAALDGLRARPRSANP